MVTECLTGAERLGRDSGSDIASPALVVSAPRVAAMRVQMMRVQMPGGAFAIRLFDLFLRLAAPEFGRIGIARAAGGIAGGGFARRPQVHDLA